MTKVVPDTNVLIEWLRHEKYSDLLFGPGLVRYLSSIVAMELYAGAHFKKERDGVDRIYRIFDRTRRIVAPEKRLFPKAGLVLEKLRSRHGYNLNKNLGLSHDVLIALSAQSIGATIITANRRDFLAIQQVTGAEFVSA